MSRLFRSPWALLGAVLLLRSAGFAFGVLNIDETDYSLFGACLWHGEIPYRDLAEIKPPLGYLTYAPAGLFGDISIIPMRVLGVLWIFATALVLKKAAQEWTGDEDAGWAAAWLSLLASVCEVPSFGGESMMNLPAAAALLYWVRARGRERPADDALCGLFIGVASLYRHQAAIAAVAFGLVLLFRRRWSRILIVSIGVAAPWLLSAAVYAAIGQLPAFVDWTVTRNFAYAGKANDGGALGRFAQSTALCVGACLVPWALAARRSFRPVDDAGRGLSLLLWLTWIAVAVGGRFYEHYYLQFIPPLAVLAAPEAIAVARRWSDLRPGLRTAMVAACLLPAIGITAFAYARGFAGRYPAQEPRTIALANWLRAHAARTDRLFVWGHYTPVYYLSKLLPGTRYPNTSVHMGNFDPGQLPPGFSASRFRSDRDVQSTLEDLERRKPAWIADTSPADIHGWSKVPLADFPALAGYINQNYSLVASPGGAAVYRRR